MKPFRLVHLGIMRLVGILGRTRCRNERRIDDGAGLERHTAFLQHPTRLGEQLFAQLVFLQQMAEPQQARRIRHRLAVLLESLVLRHRQGLLFHRRCAHRLPMLSMTLGNQSRLLFQRRLNRCLDHWIAAILNSLLGTWRLGVTT